MRASVGLLHYRFTNLHLTFAYLVKDSNSHYQKE
jgi:hypothetical protein